MEKLFQTEILGQKLPLKSDHSEDYLQQLSNYVEEMADKVRSRFATVDSLRIAIITAINIAEEYWNYRKNQETAFSLMEKRIGELQDKINSALNQTLPGA